MGDGNSQAIPRSVKRESLNANGSGTRMLGSPTFHVSRITRRLLKKPASKAAGESKPEAYPQGYVEDFDEPRTKLEGFFSSLLACESGCLTIHHPNSGQDQRDTEDFARAHWFFQ
jgi:hypothetical protein